MLISKFAALIQTHDRYLETRDGADARVLGDFLGMYLIAHTLYRT